MSTRAWVSFAVVSIVWGIPYLFIKIAVDGGITPIVLGWSRLILATTLLAAIAWRMGTLGSLRGRWRWIRRSCFTMSLAPGSIRSPAPRLMS